MKSIEKQYLVGKRLNELWEISGENDFVFAFNEWCEDVLVTVSDAKVVLEGLRDNNLITIQYTSLNPNYQIKVYVGFRKWYEEIISKYRSGISMLSGINLFKIIDVLSDINEKFQISQTTALTIKFVPQIIKFQQLCPDGSPGSHMGYREYREEACEFLKKQGVITSYEIDTDNDPIGYGDINMEIDIVKFDSAFDEYKKNYSNLNNEEKIQETKSNCFTMTYDGAELKINGVTIRKPQAEGENEQIIDFLINKGIPGKVYKKADLDKEINTESGIGKDLNKVVENITNNMPLIKKSFFKTGKSYITLFNPVDQQRLEQFKIDPKDIEKELFRYREK